MVAYIYDLGTSKEMHDKLVGIFKVNNRNQILFLENKLKNVNMDLGESIKSYFMRITQVKNDLLSIGEVIANRELTLIDIGSLSRPHDTFVTTILNNDRIPSSDELLARCTQEEIRIMERDNSYNANDPTAFSTHAQMRNDVGPSNSRRQLQGSKKGFKGRGKERCYSCNKFNH